eukprot:298777_1
MSIINSKSMQNKIHYKSTNLVKNVLRDINIKNNKKNKKVKQLTIYYSCRSVYKINYNPCMDDDGSMAISNLSHTNKLQYLNRFFISLYLYIEFLCIGESEIKLD